MLSARISARRHDLYARIHLRIPARRHALRAPLDRLPKPIKQALQLLSLLVEDVYSRLRVSPYRDLCRLLVEAMLLNSLPDDLAPRLALLAEEPCQLVLDRSRCSRALVAERSVQLDRSCARPRELECVRARRDAAAPDKWD